MSIRKVKGLESDFTIVPNQTINDKLSWSARGMLLYLCSKPDDWEVSIEDLINQTTGSAKRSGRDAVRKIMDELIECGYMRKTQNRTKGKFDTVDHEVSFIPFTENPYTAKPSTANPEQQSKDLTKYGSNKENISDISKADDTLYSLSETVTDGLYEFPLCRDAICHLDWINQSGRGKVYTGPLKWSEWEACEDAMRSVDCFDADYFTWWMKERSGAMRKTPSLPNMLCDFEKTGTDFEQFYNSTFGQEWEGE
ncbi:hypothetical protein V039C_0017 [Vibrio phage V039C]|nr:hypothetical protein V039C_0017 [Vibrio phage V039C]QJD54564.1 hypothetical protein [Vibrio phage phiV039C]